MWSKVTLAAGLVVFGCAESMGEETHHPKKAPLYFEAEMQAFNKISFNGRGDSPTESYGYILGAVSGVYDTTFGDTHSLQVKLGVAGAGLSYDSTRRASLAGDGGLGFNYIGYNQGYDGRGSASATNTRNYYVHNASLAYKNQNFTLIGGRFFQDDDAYIVGYTEGLKLGIKGNGFYADFNGISSTALLGDGFFWDYTRVYTPNGILGASVGYENANLAVRGFYYYGISEYSAPGFDIKMMFSNTESSFKSTTRLNVVFPIYDRLAMSVPVLIGGLLKNSTGTDEGFTSSILARQDFDFHTQGAGDYNLAFAVYKNVGFSQARLGLFGSPLGVNIWDNSVYASGPSLNAIVYPDATSAFVFTKARYEYLASLASALEFGLDGRYTTAPATDEYSLKLTINWELTKNVAFMLVGNYYTSVFRDPGALIDGNGSNVGALTRNQKIDRSYVMTQVSFKI